MDVYELKTFLTLHIRKGAWQMMLLFTDEVPSDKPPEEWFDEMLDACLELYADEDEDEDEDEEVFSSSLYSSKSGILKPWPIEHDPDWATLCEAIANRDWKVTRLILFGSRISDEGLKNLSTALIQGELYSLTLYYNGLQRGSKHLCEALISGDCDLIRAAFSADQIVVYMLNSIDSLSLLEASLTFVVSLTSFPSIIPSDLNLLSLEQENETATPSIYQEILIGARHNGSYLYSVVRYREMLGFCNSQDCDLVLALQSPSTVNELREAMDEYELKAFLTIHIREGAWQVVLLFMDELPLHNLPWGLYHEMWDWKVARLIISKSRIPDEGLKNLSIAVTQGELNSLSLFENGLQSQGIKQLCETLTSVNCKLTTLNVCESAGRRRNHALV
ncbi:hypothetical protein AWC38_SpisGene20240 [Stylophora pistillata]|uniref:Uncharacterized protein n=1 Tax=Stylophora pistillata TaxID=50429 RepID=A0A2B4RGD5_STYPI|nr:hypothetical protein AWC38_SpisGene20240 [Stylophora pistillata]